MEEQFNEEISEEDIDFGDNYDVDMDEFKAELQGIMEEFKTGENKSQAYLKLLGFLKKMKTKQKGGEEDYVNL